VGRPAASSCARPTRTRRGAELRAPPGPPDLDPRSSVHRRLRVRRSPLGSLANSLACGSLKQRSLFPERLAARASGSPAVLESARETPRPARGRGEATVRFPRERSNRQRRETDNGGGGATFAGRAGSRSSPSSTASITPLIISIGLGIGNASLAMTWSGREGCPASERSSTRGAPARFREQAAGYRARTDSTSEARSLRARRWLAQRDRCGSRARRASRGMPLLPATRAARRSERIASPGPRRLCVTPSEEEEGRPFRTGPR